ncbi:MAG: MFS transporter [Pseudomonadota bacterium]
MNNAIFTRFFRAGELRRVVLSFAAFFLILCSYYILRPVRDEMAVQYGADKLHWLFTGTFLLTLLVVPLFGWVVKRVSRSTMLPAVYGFLIANLLIFFIAFSPAALSMFTAAAFFMWLSVFNLFVVSLFWSNVSDSFSVEESHRLYGYIAAGGTAGALAGPAATALLAKQVSTASLVGLSALLLAGAAVCIIALRASRPAGAQDQSRPIGGSLLAGIPLTLRLSTLRGVALLVICYTAVSTVLYVEMVDLVGKTYSDSGERKAFFASIDLAVNSLSLVLQLLGTRAIVQRYGLRLALSVVPFVVLIGFGALTAWGTLAGLAMVQILHRAGEYAIGRPGREMIYTTVDAESRYKAKNFIDTAVYRANDAASAWLIAAIRGLGLNAIVFVGLPAAIAWLLTGINTGRRHDQSDRTRNDEQA